MAAHRAHTVTPIAILVLALTTISHAQGSGAASGSVGGSVGAFTPSGDCICTADYTPVCGKDNNTYANPCLAECQLGPGSWTKGKCNHDWLNPVAGCLGNARCFANPCNQPWPKDCQNKLPDNAVCFMNTCTDAVDPASGEAIPACSAIWVDPATAQRVYCNDPAVVEPGLPCSCTKEYRPVCGSNGKTYGNKCMAACDLGADGKWVEGACDEVIIEPEPSCVCTKEYRPVCGSNGKTYGNKCMAACDLGADGTWVDGACEDLNPFAGCLGNVRCSRNSCDDPCADATAGSVCFQNTCTGQTVKGMEVEPCAAVWVDPITKKVAICNTADLPVQSQDTVSCRSNSWVKCLLDPCSIKPPADCAAANEAGATCEASYCTDGVLPDGTKVGPCTALWRSPKGSLSVCPSADTPAVGGCICPMVYAPVCGVDNRTYSNDCEAGCAGVKVASRGECSDDGNSGSGSGGEGCVCAEIYAPVCGVNGKTYGNSCEAECAGVKVASTGECGSTSTSSSFTCYTDSVVQCLADPCSIKPPADCAAANEAGATCEASYCAAGALPDGTWVSPCSAIWRSPSGAVSVCSANETRPAGDGCVCPANYAPVCGVNRKTYGNKCDADCAGVRIAYSGECKTDVTSGSTGSGSTGGSGCGCTAVYSPVCGADGKTYGNLCEATCAGVVVASRGECSSITCLTDSVVRCLADPCSIKPADCAAANEAGATCEASYCAEGVLPDGTKVGPCTAVWRSPKGSLSVCPVEVARDIACTLVYAPVCGVNNKTYGNECEAERAGVKVASSGECPTGKGAELPTGEGCICPEVYMPVCGADGKTYGNPCRAQCARVVVVSRGECPPPNITCSTNVTVQCFADPCSVSSCPANPSATCVASYCQNGTFLGRPVGPCEAIYVDGAGNRVNCSATDNGVVVDRSSEIACPSKNTVQCFADPCRVNSCPANPSATCVASYCSNGTYRGQPVGPCEAIFVDRAGSRVNCNATDDVTAPSTPTGVVCSTKQTVQCFADPCRVNSCPANPSATCIASYCSNGTYRGQPVGPCEAIFVDRAGNRVNCNATDDVTVPSTPTGVVCPTGQTVQCFADPCRVNSCPANPSATCVASYCSNGTYRGQPVGPCEAIFVDRAGNRVNCNNGTDPAQAVKPGNVTRVDECPANSPRVLCAANVADGCKTASCPANPSATCITKNCAATYRGIELLPCSPIFINRTTGDLINCTATNTQPACSSCPRAYVPVCGQDGKTYPNRCAAECMGKRVKSTGKCQHCNGNECTIGQRNDLCILGAPKQCWAKKYSCQLPAGAKADSFLGKCLAKPASKKGSKKAQRHHRHMLEDVDA